MTEIDELWPVAEVGPEPGQQRSRHPEHGLYQTLVINGSVNQRLPI